MMKKEVMKKKTEENWARNRFHFISFFPVMKVSNSERTRPRAKVSVKKGRLSHSYRYKPGKFLKFGPSGLISAVNLKSNCFIAWNKEF